MEEFYSNQEGGDFYWRNDGHWSVKGEHLVVLLVAKYILENNMVAITGKAERLKIINNKLEESERRIVINAGGKILRHPEEGKNRCGILGQPRGDVICCHGF